MKTSFKVLACIIILSCMLMSHVFAETPITIRIDGKAVNFTDAAPFVDANYRTQAPLRAVAEALGCTVEWINEEQKAVITKDYTDANTLEMWVTYDGEKYIRLYEYSRKLELIIGSNTKILNSYISLYGEQSLYSGGFSEYKMNTSPIAKDNRTYLPVRYLAEEFGYDVSWDELTQTVNIISQNSIDGTYTGNIVSSFTDICAIGLYETDYTAANRDFIGVESAVITFKDGRVVDVTDIFTDAADELKEVLKENFEESPEELGVFDIAYVGKIEYDFSEKENQMFKLKVKVNIADKEGNTGYQTYNFYFNMTEGQGGYL